MEYRIYLESLFSDTKLVSDYQGKVLYNIKHNGTFSRKYIENHPTGQTIWQEMSEWDFVNEVANFLVNVQRKPHFGGDEFRFEYGGVPYKWATKSRLSKRNYLCINCNNDQQVAEFRYQHMSKTFGYVTVQPMPQCSTGLIELLIFTVVRIIEVQREEDAATAAA